MTKKKYLKRENRKKNKQVGTGSVYSREREERLSHGFIPLGNGGYMRKTVLSSCN